MGKLVCELCGSSDFVKENDYFVCQNCGMKYTVEDARRQIGSDNTASQSTTPNSQDNKKVKNLLILAERERDNNNFSKAVELYDEILREDPYNFEAVHYLFVMNYALKFVNAPTSYNLVVSNKESIMKDIEQAKGHFIACKDDQSFENDFKMYFDSVWLYIVAYPFTKYYEKIQNISLKDVLATTSGGLSTLATIINELCVRIATAYCVFIKQLFDKDNSNGFTDLPEIDISQLPDYAKEEYYKLGSGLLCMLVDTPLVIATNKDASKDAIIGIVNDLHAINPSYIIPSPKLNGYKNISIDFLKVFLVYDESTTQKIEELGLAAELSNIRKTQIEDYRKRYIETFPEHFNEIEETIKNAEKELSEVQNEIDKNNEKLKQLKTEKASFDSPLYEKIKNNNNDVLGLTSKKDSLGIFKGKEKKELQGQIDDLTAQNKELQKLIDADKVAFEAPYNKEINVVDNLLKELAAKKEETQKVIDKSVALQNEIPLPKEVRPVNIDADNSKVEVEADKKQDTQSPRGLINISSVYPMQTSLIDSMWGIPVVYSSYDGVEISWKNTSNKTIKYITYYLVAINKVGDVVPTLGNTQIATLKLVGPVESGNYVTSKSDGFWQHGLVNYIGINRVDIEFSDGTNATYQNDANKYSLWSDFYKDAGFGDKVKTIKLGWSANSPI